jgi:hypothetical protein
MVNPGATSTASYHWPLVHNGNFRSSLGGTYRSMAAGYATANKKNIGNNFVLLAIINRVWPVL